MLLPRQGEIPPEYGPFNDQRFTKALIAFLTKTKISCFLEGAATEIDRVSRDNLRDLELVDEAESRGRGSRRGNLGIPRGCPTDHEY